MSVWLHAANAEVEDNPAFQSAYQGWNAALIAVLPTSFLPGPFGTVADLAAIGFDIRLKYLPASFVAPDSMALYPDSRDNCTLRARIPRRDAEYQNLLGFFDIDELPVDWGVFGTPLVGHHNAEVGVSVQSSIFNGIDEGLTEVDLGSGTYRLDWSANTQLDIAFDVIIPLAIFLYNAELKYGKAITSTDPATAARAFAIGKEVLKDLFVATIVTGAGTQLDVLPIDAATHTQRRQLEVYDLNPPQISLTNSNLTYEAVDFGGVRLDRILDELHATVVASDPCDIPPIVSNDAPFLLPIGTNHILWSATDRGPLPPDGQNSGIDTARQTIRVEDTLAPIVLAPPNRVVESDQTATLDDIDIGTAVVFDLADPDPDLSSDAPASFPPDTRTEIRWLAEDHVGNRSEVTQWVTVKSAGTNTAPTVHALSGTTITSQPIDLTLTGDDEDLISGRFDPLNFDIVTPPGNGFFVAPLVPYFIEDFRVKPGTEIGDILNSSADLAEDLYQRYCENGGPGVPVDFVYQPEFINVTDEGESFVLDRYWQCDTGSTKAVTKPRIARFSALGIWEAQANVASSITRFTLDRDGLIYLVTPASSSTMLSLQQLDRDFNGLDIWQLEPPTDFGFPAGRLLHARMDSDNGIIYATDRQRLFAYDGADGEQRPAFLGAFMNGESFMSGGVVVGSSNRGYAIEVDADGFVYVVDSGGHQIHQFGPSSRGKGNATTLGGYVGWLGRCDSGPACDDENGRSFGYSCSDTTCIVAQASGSAPGQFATPTSIALDPEGTLYVTDYENFRVQRFTALGDFAGEAASTCDGSCFVLGDMGRPLDISVNERQFFVLDRDRDLMHVFETAPFKSITESSVVVSYASDNDFQGVDTFTYRASDGLAFSAPAEVSITVERNFRPPVALPATLFAMEDSELSITLAGSDPDGIAGVDFNGLDTLTFEVVESPMAGTLTGSPPALIYRPEPDCVGEERLTFRVSDGMFVSESATVTITVEPVNDPPTARFTAESSKMIPEKLRQILVGKTIGVDMNAPLGFPVPLFGEFDDPDAGDRHFVTIAWGDGVNDSGSTVAPPDAESGDPMITPAFNGMGQVVAEHVYVTAGDFTVEMCIFDRIGSSDCLEAGVVVGSVVDLTIDDVTNRDPLPLPGETVLVSLDIANAQPEEPVVGETATNVIFTAEMPDGAQVVAISARDGSCTETAGAIECRYPSLNVGEQVAIDITLGTAIDFDADELLIEVDVAADQPDATGDNETRISIPVRSQMVFDSGFE